MCVIFGSFCELVRAEEEEEDILLFHLNRILFLLSRNAHRFSWCGVGHIICEESFRVYELTWNRDWSSVRISFIHVIVIIIMRRYNTIKKDDNNKIEEWRNENIDNDANEILMNWRAYPFIESGRRQSLKQEEVKGNVHSSVERLLMATVARWTPANIFKNFWIFCDSKVNWRNILFLFFFWLST